MNQCKIYSEYFIRQGYNEHKVLEQAKEISLINRDELLTKQPKPKDLQKTIFVTTWHPKLKQLPSILRQNFHNLENDPRLKEVFPEKPMVAFKRKKTIRNFIVRSDIYKTVPKINNTTPCNNCRKTCHLINTANSITNIHNGRTIKPSASGNCKSKNLVYAARCKIHGDLYIGQTGDELRERFSKHRYDAKKRPENNELATHIAEYNHDFDKDIDVTILQKNIPTSSEREYYEDRYICLLGNKQPNGLNQDVKAFADEMYDCAQQLH